MVKLVILQTYLHLLVSSLWWKNVLNATTFSH